MKKIFIKLTTLITTTSLVFGLTACGTNTLQNDFQLSYNLNNINQTSNFGFRSFATPADQLNIMDMSSGQVTVQSFNSELVLITAMGDRDKTSNLSIKASAQTNPERKTYKNNSVKFSKLSSVEINPLDMWLENQRITSASYLKSNGAPRTSLYFRTKINVGDKQKFWIQDMRTGINNAKPVKQDFVLKKVTPHGYFWVDESDLQGINLNGNIFNISEAAIDKMSQYWENVAYPTGAKYFGGISQISIDNDPHFYFFLSSKLGTKVLGYFSPIDLIGKPTSNNHKILYINDLFATNELTAKYEGTINSTVIHEFQHFLNFDHKVFQPAVSGQEDKIVMEELWLNEALSTLAEQLGGFGLPTNEPNSIGMVRNFLENAPSAPLVTNSYQKFQYGQSYLFSLYLYEHFGKEKLTNALTNSNLAGIKNVENATGQPFSKTFTNWGLALCFDGLTKVPEYNYQTIDLHGTYGTHKFSGLKLTEVDSYPYNTNVTVDNWSFLPIKFNGGNGSSLLSINMKTTGKLLATGVNLK